jgi:hypothetical protein
MASVEVPDLRGTALERLRRYFAAEQGRGDGLAIRRYTTALLRCDKAFAAVSGRALDTLPPPEREAWLAFWRDVDTFLGGTPR